MVLKQNGYMVLVIEQHGGQRDDARHRVVVEYPVYPDGPFFHDRGYGCLGPVVCIDHLHRASEQNTSCFAQLHGSSVADE